jgi:hypothetical protein
MRSGKMCRGGGGGGWVEGTEEGGLWREAWRGMVKGKGEGRCVEGSVEGDT